MTDQKGIGVKIGGILISMLRFAYNIVGLAIPEKYLQAALNVMNIMFNEYSLKIIAAKTKILMLYKKNISSINIAVESIV